MSLFENLKFEKTERDAFVQGSVHAADVKLEDGGCVPVHQVCFADDLRPATESIQCEIHLPSSHGFMSPQALLAKSSPSTAGRDDANSSESLKPSQSVTFASSAESQKSSQSVIFGSNVVRRVFSLDAAEPFVQPFAERFLDPPMVEDQTDCTVVMSARLITRANPATVVTSRHDTMHSITSDDHTEHVEGTHPHEVESRSLPSKFASDVGVESQPTELDAVKQGMAIASTGRVYGSFQTHIIINGIDCAHNDSRSKTAVGDSNDSSPAPTTALAGNVQTDEDQNMLRVEPTGSAAVPPTRASIAAAITATATAAAAADAADAAADYAADAAADAADAAADYAADAAAATVEDDVYCSGEARSSIRGSHHQSFPAPGCAQSVHPLPLLDEGAVLMEKSEFFPMQTPLTADTPRPVLTAGGTGDTIERPIDGSRQQRAPSPELFTAHLQPVDSSGQLRHAEMRHGFNQRIVEAPTSCDLREVTSERSIVLGHGIAQEAETPTGNTVDPGLEDIAQAQTKCCAIDQNNSLAMVVYTGDRTLNRTSKLGNSGGRTREIIHATHGYAATTLARTNLLPAAGRTELRHRHETARIVEKVSSLLTAEEIKADTATHRKSCAIGRSGVQGGSRVAGGPMLVASRPYPSQPGTDRKQWPSNWVVMSAEQAEQAAKTLRREADKNKALESTVRKHKRERVLIYDAAMKQAAKREEDAIYEATQSLQREQLTMRTELDAELRKVSDLYQERCRDYALMVSDECEGEISKQVSGLRKDWARQKKTIEQLVRDADGEDRQVAVVASAITGQLAEERKQELDDMRAEIYADIRAEFEAREVAMKDALQSDHQSELEGQLLLAEIRHQKELDRLRMELSGAAITASASGTPSTGRFVMYHVGKKRATEGAGEAINSDVHPCIPSPSLMRGVRGVAVGKNGQRLRGVGDGEKSALGGGRRCLGGKLPSFKMPAPTAPPNDAGDKGVQQGKTKLSGRPSSADETDASPPFRARVKRTSRPTATNIGITERSTNGAGSASIERSPEDQEDQADINLMEGITSALMVSPTKSVAELKTVTPSMDATTEVPPRPKKRGKRLFTSTA